ncbi:hypothetical protein HZA42_04525 [Candidatus Peregrinibacteria bacterium]|nr:hypothetical protein [Candidatus Peregrinibacteria bacterium]
MNTQKVEMTKTALAMLLTAALFAVTNMVFFAISGQMLLGLLIVSGEVLLVFCGLIKFSDEKPKTYLEVAVRALQAVTAVFVLMALALIV